MPPTVTVWTEDGKPLLGMHMPEGRTEVAFCYTITNASDLLTQEVRRAFCTAELTITISETSEAAFQRVCETLRGLGVTITMWECGCGEHRHTCMQKDVWPPVPATVAPG